MKKTHLAILFIFVSCTYFETKQQQADGLAKKYLDSTLKGSDKYEIIKTSPIDTLRGGPDNEPDYQIITEKIDNTYKIGDSLNKKIANTKNNSEISILQKLSKKNYNKRNMLLEQSLQYLLGYKGKPEGWIIEQTYRSTNSIDTDLYIATFKLDEKLSKVLSQQTTKK
ncbi:hypothetical protein [Mucilaginibacter sp.]|uniref:hypothetical protein n=1 Tax=Mucilaginibacter sp. TaxID=1882438 RepID=UPI0026341799|nr:hypothetical protein [Mucilaginibacter sp.]MDB5031053.1 hypothetical protein [Mucilaginibacter sp.]